MTWEPMKPAPPVMSIVLLYELIYENLWVWKRATAETCLHSDARNLLFPNSLCAFKFLWLFKPFFRRQRLKIFVCNFQAFFSVNSRFPAEYFFCLRNIRLTLPGVISRQRLINDFTICLL